VIGRERIRADIGPPTIAWQVFAVAAIVVAVLLVLADSYGFHRDELYFIVAGRHPDWGYVDQPPITPLISAGAVDLVGLSPLSVRILPALAVAICIVLAADMARQLGGSGRAQLIAATTVALSGFLGTGHLGTTTTFDLLAWTVVLWLVVRLLAGSDRRLWLGVGLAAGIGLENKDLVLFLGLSLGIGLVVSRRWDVVRSPWAWSAVGIALVLWLPNLIWQASHGFPQLELARHIGTESGDENRALLLPFQLLISGPVLFPIMLVGLGWLIRDPLARPWRATAWAYLALLVVLIITGGKGYYAAGYLPPLIAAGAIVTDRWLARGRRLVRGSILVVATIVSGLGAGS
jgi:4-amino-4-deoxy-L-arabinose transferase-like glycosyltransferase